MNLAEILRGVAAREPVAVARAISLVENQEPAAPALVAALPPRGHAFRIGMTGPPGAGKSTLVDQVVASLRADGQSVAVLAVDPSSPLSGGAILGDRVRMQRHATDAGVFVRSLATRGRLGGVSAATQDAADILDAAGFDVVIIETVGVGQAEVDVVHLSDVAVLVLAPGAGDDIQALKAGIMEVADVFVINKADLAGAAELAGAIAASITLDGFHLGPRPKIVQTIATTGGNIAELRTALARVRVEREAEIRERRLRRDEARRPGPLLLDHVAIATDDASRLAEALGALFGARCTAAEVMPEQGVRVRFVDAAGAPLELIEPSGTPSAIETFLARRGPGLHHVAFRVTDIDRRLEDLRARGIRLVDQRPRAGAHGSRIAFIHPSATGGVLVELVERPRSHP